MKDEDDEVAYALKRIADSITPNIAPGRDDTGGTVASLTEALMGMTAGLVQIANAITNLSDVAGAIDNLADAVRGADASYAITDLAQAVRDAKKAPGGKASGAQSGARKR